MGDIQLFYIRKGVCILRDVRHITAEIPGYVVLLYSIVLCYVIVQCCVVLCCVVMMVIVYMPEVRAGDE